MLPLGVLLLPMVLAASTELTIDNYVVKIVDNTLTSVRSTGRSSINLNLSGLGLQLIDKDAFNDPIGTKTLDLANNSLVDLPESVFSKLTDLQHLSLVDNKIKHFVNAFVGLGNLKSLNISNNPIGYLGPSGFNGLSSSVEIFTLGSPIGKISTSLFEKNIESIRNRRLARIKRSVPSDIGKSTMRFKVCIDHGKMKLVDHLKENEILASNCTEKLYNADGILSLDDLNITSFEKNWYRLVTKSIYVISLNNNEISQVTSEALNDLPRNIKDIGLIGNKIERLENGIIENFNIRVLFINKNLIHEIENGALERTNLQYLIADENRLKDMKFVSTLPSSINIISIERNRLTEIPDGLFLKLGGLEDLRLDDNYITEIRKDSLRGLSGLTRLGLSNNRLRSIESGSFRDFRSLDYVDLRNNSIDKLDVGVFDGPDIFTSINLGMNKFTDVREQIRDGLPHNLDELILDYNEIESLEIDSFVNVPKRTLNLRANRISMIANESFQLPELLMLDLGNNSLSWIDGESFKKCRKLQTLSLKENAITKIKKGFTKHLDNIRQLDLSVNPIKRLENGALFGMRKDNAGRFIITSEAPIELIQGGLFDDL